MSYRAPVEDLQFLIGQVLEGRELFALAAFRHADFEIVATVLAEGARLAAEVIEPINQPGDRAGARIENGSVVTAPGFREAYARYTGDGWPGLDMPLVRGASRGPILQLFIGQAKVKMRLGGRFPGLYCTIQGCARILETTRAEVCETERGARLNVCGVCGNLLLQTRNVCRLRIESTASCARSEENSQEQHESISHH